MLTRPGAFGAAMRNARRRLRVDPVADPTYEVPASASGAAAANAYAIVVAHGMGEQVRFQTLDDLTEELRRRYPEHIPDKPLARTVLVGGERQQRLEITLTGLEGGRSRKVHIYEAYWAPLTKGHVGLLDVMLFLIAGGLYGIRIGTKQFKRWLFGRYVEYPAPIRTVAYFLLALLVAVSLIVVNAVGAAVLAARLPVGTPPPWLTPMLFRDLTTVLNVVVTVAALFVVALLATKWTRGITIVHRVLSAASVAAFIVAVLTTIAAGVAAPAVTYVHARDHPPLWGQTLLPLLPPPWRSVAAIERFNSRFDSTAASLLVAGTILVAAWLLGRYVWQLTVNLVRFPNMAWFTILSAALLGATAWIVGFELTALLASGRTLQSAWGGSLAHQALAWPLVVFLGAGVRWFLIAYAGDVAVYVQPQKLDRFAKLRQEIKDCVLTTARAVYREPYEKIVLVGHSLGSVVVYDVLNRLLLLDDRADVEARTAQLLTFGSPLDKTAFLFAVQGEAGEAREALAASLQPLLLSRSKNFSWVNIHSPWDLISGHLDYYDLPAHDNDSPVENVRDPAATTLLVAHVEYWKTAVLYERLFAALSK